MYYITKKAPPKYKQMTLEDLLFGNADTLQLISPNFSNTITYEREKLPERLYDAEYIGDLIKCLQNFNSKWRKLFDIEKEELFSCFYIPKKSGGLRRIDAPVEKLMTALRELKEIFEERFGALYHTSAFAYIKNRSTIKCMQRHQHNNSRWYSKFDMTNFFGSTTMDFVMQQFGMIYPFCYVLEDEIGRAEFD